jgi:hypothetical protein
MGGNRSSGGPEDDLAGANRGSGGPEDDLAGGNRSSGGPEKGLAGGNGDSGRKGPRDGDDGSARPAGADEKDSAGETRGANGLRTRTRKPHRSQNWPATVAPQAGQVSPLSGVAGSGPWCFPTMRPGPEAELTGFPSMRAPQTSQKSLLAER